MTTAGVAVPIEALATLRRRLAVLPGRYPQRETLLSSTAELYGISRATLYRLLRGERRPRDAHRADRGTPSLSMRPWSRRCCRCGSMTSNPGSPATAMMSAVWSNSSMQNRPKSAACCVVILTRHAHANCWTRCARRGCQLDRMASCASDHLLRVRLTECALCLNYCASNGRFLLR
jgi:hypothetical protein